jgi:hypothetical protein
VLRWTGQRRSRKVWVSLRRRGGLSTGEFFVHRFGIRSTGPIDGVPSSAHDRIPRRDRRAAEGPPARRPQPARAGARHRCEPGVGGEGRAARPDEPRPARAGPRGRGPTPRGGRRLRRAGRPDAAGWRPRPRQAAAPGPPGSVRMLGCRSALPVGSALPQTTWLRLVRALPARARPGAVRAGHPAGPPEQGGSASPPAASPARLRHGPRLLLRARVRAALRGGLRLPVRAGPAALSPGGDGGRRRAAG